MKHSEKIKSLDDLSVITNKKRAEGEVIVHCHGVFDLLHIGHIKHLAAARKMGDFLTVTITPDKFVNKGPHRPAFPDVLRAEALAALGCVDYVAINKWATAVETIRLLKPSKYVKGVVHSNGKRDHTNAIDNEDKAVKSVGGELILTDEETYSASTLINRFVDIFTEETKEFLAEFREKFTPEQVIGYVQQIQSLKILTIGEIIIDEYQFCSAMGKANKEAVLAVKSLYKETYAGGILAVANHVSNFCDNVGLISFLGENSSYESFIKEKLYPGVSARLMVKSGCPTIVKRRFIEEYLGAKLFEVYEIENGDINEKMEEEFCGILDNTIDDYDVVVVADYGHGLLSEKSIDILCDKAKFLAVNTQTNAGNMGFNTISKYNRANYISIAEPEIRLDNRKTNEDLDDLIRHTSSRLSCDTMMITRGKLGCVVYDKDNGITKTPALSVKMVDRIGAGDAVLSITAPLVYLKAPTEIVSFIGNVVGAEACAIMGNKSSIETSSLYRHITSLMK
ncbi:Glycerol-3-phosphate cytidylyltransferase [hydrothermal vent metagenome]|uniref:Glycerol-3-phosphate cytidylyltransferase n=1 Tax=hydrothermal vent metagenome TaxID=652676 RepID=A0A3B1CCY1_9ZZZZ